VKLQPGAAYHYSVRAVGLESDAVTEAAWQIFTPPGGVVEPLSHKASQGSGPGGPGGGSQLGGGQASSSGTPPSSGHDISNPPGGSSKTGSSKHKHKHKHKQKHKHHGKKAAKRRG